MGPFRRHSQRVAERAAPGEAGEVSPPSCHCQRRKSQSDGRFPATSGRELSGGMARPRFDGFVVRNRTIRQHDLPGHGVAIDSHHNFRRTAFQFRGEPGDNGVGADACQIHNLTASPQLQANVRRKLNVTRGLCVYEILIRQRPGTGGNLRENVEQGNRKTAWRRLRRSRPGDRPHDRRQNPQR